MVATLDYKDVVIMKTAIKALAYPSPARHSCRLARFSPHKLPVG